MNNLQLIREVAYQERIHRELHGVEASKAYLRVLRKAASVADVEGVFADVTFNDYGLAEGGPFVKH